MIINDFDGYYIVFDTKNNVVTIKLYTLPTYISSYPLFDMLCNASTSISLIKRPCTSTSPSSAKADKVRMALLVVMFERLAISSRVMCKSSVSPSLP